MIAPRKLAELLHSEVKPEPLQTHKGDGFTIESQLTLGPEPRLRISWESGCWSAGFRLLGFRNAHGFAEELRPQDLKKHGSLIIDSRKDEWWEQPIAEGEFYFTFLLHRKGFLADTFSDTVRFHANVPTAKIVLGRAKDQIELYEIVQEATVKELECQARTEAARLLIETRQQERGKLNALPPPLPEPVAKPTWAQSKRALILEFVESVIVGTETRKQIVDDPKFAKLDDSLKSRILGMIDREFDPSEISAALDEGGR